MRQHRDSSFLYLTPVAGMRPARPVFVPRIVHTTVTRSPSATIRSTVMISFGKSLFLPASRCLVLLQIVISVQSMVYEILGVNFVRNLELPLIEISSNTRRAIALFLVLLRGVCWQWGAMLVAKAAGRGANISSRIAMTFS